MGYWDYYRGPFPHSLLRTKEVSCSGAADLLKCSAQSEGPHQYPETERHPIGSEKSSSLFYGGLYLESYKVTPKGNYFEAYDSMSTCVPDSLEGHSHPPADDKPT